MRIVFWQGEPSMHQSAMLRSLAKRNDTAVTLAVERGAAGSHLDRGGAIPDLDGVAVVDVRDPAARRRLTRDSDRDTVHIASGFFTLPVATRAFDELRGSPSMVGFLSESFDTRGARGWIRRRRARHQVRRRGRRIDLGLAMGDLGVAFFRDAGLPSDRVHPFSYFTEPAPASHDTAAPLDGPFRVTFVGRLIPRKGVDLLIRALARLDGREVMLRVVGDGPERERLMALARRLGVEGRVGFVGTLPNQDVAPMLAASDLLVLPSRWDGWGAVVNEALGVGTPALVSDRCGAGALLEAAERGAIFRGSASDALAEALDTRVGAGPLPQASRRRIADWARCTIGGESGATHLAALIEAARTGAPAPPPPWAGPS